MIKELETKILEAKRAYYADNPIMSDNEFDLLVEKLKALDPHNRILQLTGTDIKDNKRWAVKKLTTRLGSQEKVNSIEELNEWMKGFEGKKITFEPKGDGISIELTYKKGRLVSAITRGDGYEGEDILANVLKMKNVIHWWDSVEYNLVLKGEILITHKDFEKLNSISEKKYANPRNAAGGIAKSKDGENCEYLTIMYWDYEDLDNKSLPKYVSITNILGVEFMERYDISEVDRMYETVSEVRNYFGFDVDGFVVKVDEPVQMKGNVPTNQIALKFPAEQAVATILTVQFNEGRTGKITPVAVFDEPVHLLGSEVSRCSIGSWGIYQKKKLGAGAVVVVSRANDVIPKIVEVIKEADVQDLDSIRDHMYPSAFVKGEHLYIDSPRLTLLPRVCHMFNILEISDVSEKTIERILDIYDVRDMWEIFDLDYDALKTYNGFGNKKVENIKQQLENKKKVSIKTFIACLGIPGFASSRISEFVDYYNIKQPIDMFISNYDELKEVQGFSDIMVNNLDTWLYEHHTEILELAKRLTIEDEPTQVKNVLGGKKFCITGKTSMKRTEFEKLIKENNGKISSINQADYLITNDTSTGTAKNKAAIEKGITIISEKQFFETFNL